MTAQRATEGVGFKVRRPFPGVLSMARADPFLLLDHLGPQINAPEEAVGPPWHPHRGFETASDIAGCTGPGVTHTPITYAHATVAPGAQLADRNFA